MQEPVRYSILDDITLGFKDRLLPIRERRERECVIKGQPETKAGCDLLAKKKPIQKCKTKSEEEETKTSQDLHVFSMYSLCILFAWPLRVLLAFHFGKCQTKITSKMISFVSKTFAVNL